MFSIFKYYSEPSKHVVTMKIAIKKERILRTLVLEDKLTVSEISRKTGLSKSYVSKTVGELESLGCIFNGAKWLHVDNQKLIREWGNFKRTIFNSIKPISVDVFFPEKIKDIIKDYVISGPFAEMLIQGESSGRPMIIYLDENKTEMNTFKKLGKIGKGSALFYPYDSYIFNNSLKIKGWNIVAIPQVCADMIAMGTYADLGIKLFGRWLDAGRRI